MVASPSAGRGAGEGLFKATGPARPRPLTLVLSPLCKGRGEKGVCRASLQLQRAHKEDEPVVFLHAKKTHPSLRLVEPCACRSEPLHRGKRPAENEDAVRIPNTRRSAFKRSTAFRRPAALIPLEFLELLVVFEAGTVIFPPGPVAAPSSMESN